MMYFLMPAALRLAMPNASYDVFSFRMECTNELRRHSHAKNVIKPQNEKCQMHDVSGVNIDVPRLIKS